MNTTWKVVYIPKVMNNGLRGVALIEAPNRQQAMHYFMEQYSGQYHTIDSCDKLFG